MDLKDNQLHPQPARNETNEFKKTTRAQKSQMQYPRELGHSKKTSQQPDSTTSFVCQPTQLKRVTQTHHCLVAAAKSRTMEELRRQTRLPPRRVDVTSYFSGRNLPIATPLMNPW